MSTNTGGVVAEQLGSFIARIERLEEEKAGIAVDIREVYAEAKGCGFDTKTMRQIIRRRRMSKAERDEEDALVNLYESALGMLSDTPLGEATIRRLSRPKPADDGAMPEAEPESPGKTEEITEADLAEAAEKGRQAARDGAKVTDNPYVARDPRRAAWEHAWCQELGTDGMEIPEAFRRSKPKKDDKPGAPK